jgi:hypothetical protein
VAVDDIAGKIDIAALKDATRERASCHRVGQAAASR